MYQAKNNNYRNEHSIIKAQSRDMFLDKLRELEIRQLRYVGLPSLSPFLEKELLDIYSDATLYLAEVNPMVFAQQKNVLPKKLKVYQRIMHTHDNVFSCYIPFAINAIWFDTCSIFNYALLENMKSFLIHNSLQEKGVMALTICASREQPTNVQFYNWLLGVNDMLPIDRHQLKEFRTKSLPVILCRTCSEYLGLRFEICDVLPYKSDKGAMMQYFAFKWYK